MLSMKRFTGATLCVLLALSVSNSFAFGFGKDKFEQELEKEAGGSKNLPEKWLAASIS